MKDTNQSWMYLWFPTLMLWLGIAIGVKTSACAQQVSWKQMTIRFTLFKVILSISSCAFNDEFIAERKKVSSLLEIILIVLKLKINYFMEWMRCSFNNNNNYCYARVTGTQIFAVCHLIHNTYVPYCPKLMNSFPCLFCINTLQ